MTKIALVTGAGTGVGKAITRALLAGGFAVALTGRRRDVLDETAAELGGDTLVHPADISVDADVTALFDAVVGRYGRPDLLVNNAGMSAPAIPIDELEVDVWTQVVGANLTGAFLCTRASFRQMKRQDPQGGASSTTVRFRPPRPGRIRRPTPRPSTPSPASPSRRRSTAGRSTSPVARSISAMLAPP